MSAQQAYCALEKTLKSNGDLESVNATFYYDNLRSSRSEAIDLSETIDVPEDGGRILYIPQEIPLPDYINIVFDSSFANYRPKSTSYWFYWLQAREKVSFEGWENLNTSEVTNMSSMFYALGRYETNDGDKTCKVENLDLSHFDTSKVTDMTNMLSYMYLDDGLDISSFTINPGTQTISMMGQSIFKSITLPATANNLADDAFRYVGSGYAPVTLFCPEDVITTPYYANGESKGDEIEIKARSIEEVELVDANIAEDEGYDDSSCYKVSSSKEATNDYDSGFFVYTPNHYWKEGDRYRFKMKVRAAKAATITIQSHEKPNIFLHWEMLGRTSYEVTTEWQEIVYEGNITADQAKDNGMQTIVFLLNHDKIDNDFYFDDISWEAIDVNDNDMEYFVWKEGYFMVPPKPERYAVLSTDKTALTFYYDEDRKSHVGEGTVYRMSFEDSKEWTNYSSNITKVELTSGFANNGYADQLPYNYFTGIGSDTPCLLYYPTGFTPKDTSTENGYILWKEGHFNTTSPYVVLSSDKKTLTFYCDNKRGTHSSPEATFAMISSNGRPVWQTNQSVDKSIINTVVFDESFSHYHPTTCFFWFADMTSLNNIQHLDFLKTDQAEAFVSMFNRCYALKSIDISHFDFSGVTNGVNSMFANCTSLESLDLSSYVFKGNNNAYMLGNCPKLSSLTVSAEVNKLPDDAFENVGTAESPCQLFFAEELTPEGATFENSYMLWKKGYFMIEGDAYAQIDGNTMTFYYDKQFGKRQGKAYRLNEGNIEPDWQLNPNKENITKVVFESSFKITSPTSCFAWFSDFTSLNDFENLNNLNTSNVTNMSNMFSGCENLTGIDLSNFDTSNVTDMSGMFKACPKLDHLSLFSFNTSKVTDMSEMFFGCHALTYLDVSNFDTYSASNLQGMFSYCAQLGALDLSNFTLMEGSNTDKMLEGCFGLRVLEIPITAYRWDENTCRYVGTRDMPCGLIYPTDFQLEESATGDGWYIWKTGYFTDTYPYAVLSDDNLTLTFYYDDQSNKRSGTVYVLNYGDEAPKWLTPAASVTHVKFDPSFANARPESTSCWFDNMKYLETIEGIEYLNTEQVTNMALMFYGASSLKEVDLSHFNTSKVTNMALLFSYSSNLKSVDVSHFDTSNVTNMVMMFYNCSSLESLDLSSFTFIEKDGLSSLFLFNCSALQELTLPATGNRLPETSCNQVGTAENPCVLNGTGGFTPEGAETHDDYFIWRGGHFKTGSIDGDANGDDRVTIADVMMTVKASAGDYLNGFIEKNADVNHDNTINVTDVMLIVKMLQ